MIFRKWNLVKLIDQADSFVSKHKGSSLERPLSGDGVALDVGGQADRWRTLTGGENDSRRGLLDVLQKLRLGGPRIAADQNVDVTANFVFAPCWQKEQSSTPQQHRLKNIIDRHSIFYDVM